uniref:Uncharacterized protein n=1 Tax=Cucumis melo TaxID=3656 RepID=A0A9I9D1T7_CUCME
MERRPTDDTDEACKKNSGAIGTKHSSDSLTIFRVQRRTVRLHRRGVEALSGREVLRGGRRRRSEKGGT